MAKMKFEDLIIREDDNYIVINKPAFISTLADRNDSVNILVMARAYHEGAQVCHRLDKETTGALVIAKNPDAYRHMSIQFENREVRKIYHAVSDGIHDFNNKEVDRSILKLGNGTVRIDHKGKEAKTIFNTLKAYSAHTLIECMPVTGRMHQIRVHLSSIGAPITGDEMYGGKSLYLSSIKRKYNLKKWTEEQPLIKRLALHAHSLTFKLLNHEELTIEAPYPKDFRVLTEQLEKNS
ncbi:RluA family pseudouridine synthase [Fulvivirga sp. 29W222]|uniref:RluA family pseudouridine synthase n=1 Tax=Fulvivirga marina TaxID=2494733 RepID=A0A937KB25_9BACT|nr:RluA family pseudouridine synthase [Fulvivirga marina]MBL6445472.1 RluA family pseudouridine synthase [Fulvivirga marina]